MGNLLSQKKNWLEWLLNSIWFSFFSNLMSGRASNLAVQQMETSCTSLLSLCQNTLYILDNKGQECWTNRDPTYTHTHTQLSMSQDRGLGRTKGQTDENDFSCAYQNACKSLLQFTWIGHGQFQRHVVPPEIRVLVHAPCVPHDSSLTSKYNFSPSSLFHFLREKKKKKSPHGEKKENFPLVSFIVVVFLFCSVSPHRLQILSWSLLQHEAAHVREAA